MKTIHLSVVTPGRKEITAKKVLDTHSFRLHGFDDEAMYTREDLLALANLFTGLAALLGEK